MVAGDRRRHAAGPWRAASVRPEQVVAVSCTGQWASTVPVGRGRATGRATASCGWTAGALPTRAAPWAARSRAMPRWPCGAGCDTAAAPRPRRGPTPSGTCCTSSTRSPTVAQRARWYLEPVDYLSMRFTGVAAASHASMTGGVADRQPPARATRLRPCPGAAAPASPPTSSRPWCRPARWWARSTRRSPTSSASRRGRGGDRDPRPPLRRGRVGCRARLPDPPRHQHDVVDQLPGADEEDRRRSTRSRRSRDWRPVAT